MFKVFLFMAVFMATEVGAATCADDLNSYLSQAGQTYASGFTPPADGSLGFFDLHGRHARQVRDKRVNFERASLAELIYWLHSYGHADHLATARAIYGQDEGAVRAMRRASGEITPLIQDALTRLLAHDDEALTPSFEELVAIAADLSRTFAGHGVIVPLVERLADMSLARGDVARRRVLVAYVARVAVQTPGDRGRLERYMPEWLAQAGSAGARLDLLARIINAQVALGGTYTDSLIRMMVDELPVYWDSAREPLSDQGETLVRSALESLQVIGASSLSTAQKARLSLLRQAFPN